MNEIEKRFAEEKERLESVTAPVELEERLRKALDGVPVKKRRKLVWLMTAVALLFFSLVSYNYNGLAYYGKKIMGFEELMSSTLAELNEEGMGQLIGESVALEDGTELTVDGIMTDANQFILYYTLSNVSEDEDIPFARIKGFLTDSNRGQGLSIWNEEKSEIKGQMYFEPVSPFAKKLTLEYTKWSDRDDGKSIGSSITFPYDPNKAMQTEIKRKLNKTVKVDKGTIKFKSITATPTVTIINGRVNVENLSRVPNPFGGVELRANGKPLGEIISGSTTSSGFSSLLKGAKFSFSFNPLPKELDSLELVIKDFVGYSSVNDEILLDSTNGQPHIVKGKEVWVRDVSVTEDGVEVRIATDEDVMLDGVTVGGQGYSLPLKTTVRQEYEELEGGRIVKVRTLLFSGDRLPEYMGIKGMHHMKPVGEIIEIPVK